MSELESENEDSHGSHEWFKTSPQEHQYSPQEYQYSSESESEDYEGEDIHVSHDYFSLEVVRENPGPDRTDMVDCMITKQNAGLA